MTSPPGICPNCREAGPIATPCPERACALRGYHRIPPDMATPGTWQDPELGLLLDGRYLVVKTLGEGGFGKVFLALQQPLGMRVALKILKRDADAEAHESRMRLFRQEAQAMAQLQHPNIVKIMDFGFIAGAAYLVMELIEGSRTLKAEIRRRAVEQRDLTLHEVESILTGVLAALDKAHSRRIIHRDVKPENIMLQEEPGHPMLARLLDFGLARFVDANTQSSAILGTPIYMAPEQLTREDLGPWTDLYALGIVAYELMTGRRPFGGEVGQVLAQKRDPHYDVLAAVADLELPVPITQFLRRALAFEPARRFADASRFRDAMLTSFKAAEGAGRDDLRSVDLTALLGNGTSNLRRAKDAAAGTLPLPMDQVPAAPTLAVEPVEPVEPVSTPAPMPVAVPTVTPRAAPDGASPAEVSLAAHRAATAAADIVPDTTLAVPLAAIQTATPPRRTVAAVAEVPDEPSVRLDVSEPKTARRRAPLIAGMFGVAGVVGVVVAAASSGSQPEPTAAPGRQTVTGASAALVRPDADVTAGKPDVVPATDVAVDPLMALAPAARVVAIAQGPVNAASLERATAALAEIAPEVAFQVRAIQRISATALAGSDKAGFVFEGAPGTVFVVPAGRHLMQHGMHLRGKREIAIFAEEGSEIFSRSGEAVLTVSGSEKVLLHGLYMNHHDLDVNGKRVDSGDCMYTIYRPRIKTSDVLDVLDSKQVSVRKSDLEGTGFIGIKAIGTTDLYIFETVIHDCISEAIRLEKSTARAEDVMMTRIGARSYPIEIRCAENYAPGHENWCKKYPPAQYFGAAMPGPVTFKTAVYVDAGSSLDLVRATLVVPQPLPRSQAFEIEGRLSVADSIIDHTVGLLKSKGSAASISFARTCVSGGPPKDAVATEAVLFGVAMTPAPTGAGQGFVNRVDMPNAEACAAHGARPRGFVAPQREKPKANGE